MPLCTYSQQGPCRQAVESVEYGWHEGLQQLESVALSNEDDVASGSVERFYWNSIF